LPSAQINRQDCLSGDQIEFSLTITNPNPSLALQAWAGFNCDDIIMREVAGLCWKLGPDFAVSSTSPPPIAVPVSVLLAGRTLAGIQPNGTASSPGAPPNPDACRDASGATSAQPLSVYFMLVDGSATIQGTAASWQASYKLNAPAPPDHVSLGTGAEPLLVNFSYDESTDTTIKGYQLYCEPNSAGGASENGDAGPPACVPSSRLVAGADVSNLQDLRCGSASRAATSATIKGLTDGLPYNVAVATIDSYDNVSVLSPVACAAPAAAVSEQTAKACSFAASRPSFPLLPMLGVGLCLVRRRRRR
jgi:hypothetical protein